MKRMNLWIKEKDARNIINLMETIRYESKEEEMMDITCLLSQLISQDIVVVIHKQKKTSQENRCDNSRSQID